MGGLCCACHRAPQILEDPSITIKARAGDFGVGGAHVSHHTVRGGCEGVIYVDDDSLRYVGCCVYSTRLENITNIEVVDGYVLMGGKRLVLRPGLKISLKNGSMIAVAVPEAQAFAGMLSKVVPS